MAAPSQLVRGAAVLALALLTACGGVRMKTVQVRALDVDDQERVVPCMYVVDDQWPDPETANQQLLTRDVNTIKLPFNANRDYVELELVPLQDGDIQEDGTLRVVPSPTEPRTMSTDENPREVRWTDPADLLFLFFVDYSRG